MKPTSFEGHFKSSNFVSYNREKQLSAKELTQNAEYQRKLRAKLKKEREALNKWNEKHKCLRDKMENIRKIKIIYESEISKIQCAPVASERLKLILQCSDTLCKFYVPGQDNKKYLIQVIQQYKDEALMNEISGDRSVKHYYAFVSFSLLLRLTAKSLRLLPQNTAASDYNIYLRFFEIILTKYLQTFDIPIKTKCNFIDLLTRDSFFGDINQFFYNQFLINDEQIYIDSPKLLSIINVIFKPLLSYEPIINIILNRYLKYSFIKSIYDLKSIKEMEFSFSSLFSIKSPIYLIESILKIINNDFNQGYLYLLLKCCEEFDLNDNTELSRQMVIIISKSCRKLMENDTINLRKALTENNVDIIENMDDSDDDDADDSDAEHNEINVNNTDIINQSNDYLNNIISLLKGRFSQIVIGQSLNCELLLDNELMNSIGYLYYLFVLETKIIDNNNDKILILKLINNKNGFMTLLWKSCLEHSCIFQSSNFIIKHEIIIEQIINGYINEDDNEINTFFGKLLCFANCLNWRLTSVQDLDLIDVEDEKYREIMEFTPQELCKIVLKLRDIMYGLILNLSMKKLSLDSKLRIVKIFRQLKLVVMNLYNRDIRKGLLMKNKRIDWVKPELFHIDFRTLFKYSKDIFQEKTKIDLITHISNLPTVNYSHKRQFMILREMPFILPFGTRLRLFKELLQVFNSENSLRSDNTHSFFSKPVISIRRDYLYEDAYNQLLPSAFPNLNVSSFRIQFIDHFGMIESGIDGGGLLKEFLANILKEACDPNRGLFCQTNNNLVYPNPEVDVIYPDNWREHYYFVGRMLGLVISLCYTVDVPFATFFLQLLFAENPSSSKIEINIDNLQYLDELLYRNLLSLKSDEHIDEHQLDFAICRSRYGCTEVVELKPNGSNIPVTKENVVEYIYLMSYYRLNKAIVKQTESISDGFNNVLSFSKKCLFELFESDELSTIVSSGDAPIDIEDLRLNTFYHNIGMYEDSERVISDFWNILHEMNDEEKRNFVQFVTSNTRPPMLGFSELKPKFGIQLIGPNNNDRLPSSSTCVNLLKLPCYENKKQMRDKLLKAIGSESGFHLS